ncbi:hypothetical protein [uncultured Roseobacter sp.]|uniref:hypothetical protein n=1 Tax=uncultured Roseobacter sp. TaxID=114847 RepID=UPI00262DBC7C|nr:hypothetical protein [uncultured Roseobacter sp.]
MDDVPRCRSRATGIAGARAAFSGFVDLRPEFKRDVLSDVIIDDIALMRANWGVVTPDEAIMMKGGFADIGETLETGLDRCLADRPNGPTTRA